MERIRYILLVLILVIWGQKGFGQDSKYLHLLVDSIPNGKPVLVNFEMEKGFMATERIAISKDGKTLYYGVRNGYNSISKADIMKLEFNKGKWSKPQVVFADSSGAPALSRDEKTMYFQYDDTLSPKGIYSRKIGNDWSKPKRFIESLKKSHYLQAPRENSFYYSSGIQGDDKIQDVFHVMVTKSDTVTKRLNFNVKGDFMDLYVAPDESFLILLINKKNNTKSYKFYSNADLFISFKNKNGTWSKPLSLGTEVHSVSKWNWGPYVTQDKKYLFFSSWGETVGTYMIDFEPIYNRLKLETENR
ncbi:hypothetical protein [Flavivirga eckloniae]|uniref:Uncharacterized protein n=1 Tax=Flavivirga eckloniae TaxID=1803846 RepID=A0A2K9PMJ3_9FLAO|nr:hypothetical protein [Flavivirga eckloniae]AUP78289.1 hypothetical protein C1H87_05995 [Flavivirga eckloniae]